MEVLEERKKRGSLGERAAVRILISGNWSLREQKLGDGEGRAAPQKEPPLDRVISLSLCTSPLPSALPLSGLFFPLLFAASVFTPSDNSDCVTSARLNTSSAIVSFLRGKTEQDLTKQSRLSIKTRFTVWMRRVPPVVRVETIWSVCIDWMHEIAAHPRQTD